MKAKMKIKMGIDFLMTVLLFLLMSYQITGQELHEWFGAEMLVLFLLHNILNIRWYGSLFKGKYTLLRIMQMIINISVLMLRLMFGKVEDSVMHSCITYLRISAYSYPALAVYNAGAALFRSIGKTSLTMYLSVISNIINVVGNLIGVFVLRAGARDIIGSTKKNYDN